MNENKTHNIGILLPQSNAYPLIGKEFIQGLKLGLGSEANYKLSIESIAFGSDPQQLINAAQKLTFQEDVVLTTGLLGHYGLSELTEYYSKNDEILLVASLGATKPIKYPEGTYQNSLGLYNAMQDLVLYFSKNGVQKIETSTCYYEAGYGFVEALSNSIDAIEGVEFSGHFITPLEPRPNEAELMTQHITEDNPNAIVAFHNGVFAEEHATFLKANGLHKKYPIYALPFSCDDQIIEKNNDIFQTIKTISSWYPELNNVANNTFIEAYKTIKDKNPSFFSLLGYENGLIIANALKQIDSPLKTSLSATSIEGPRGIIAFDNEISCTNFDQYLWEVTDNKKSIITKLDTNPMPRTTDNTVAAGWINAYLCH